MPDNNSRSIFAFNAMNYPNNVRVKRARPEFLDASTKADAIRLVTDSGLLHRRDAESRINRAFLVMVGYKNNRATATLTVKQPDAAYVTKLFRRANVIHTGESLEFGYLYAPAGSGTLFNGPRLYREAIEVIRRTNTKFYAVTRADNETMTKYLSRKLGWHQSAPFASERGNYKLILWTGEPQRMIVQPRNVEVSRPVTTPNANVSLVGTVRPNVVGAGHHVDGISIPPAWNGKRVRITLDNA